MSAFGHAGFGSRNRQNQLRAQGQMDPYGNQVRQAIRPPTFNIYNTPAQYQQATAQQPASTASGGQTATTASGTGGTAMPAYSGGTTSMPAYDQPTSSQPQTGGPFPTYDDWMSGQQQSGGTATTSSGGTSQPPTGGPTPTATGGTQPSTPPAEPQTGGPFPTYDDWMSGQGSSNYVNPPMGGPFPTYDSVMGPQTGGPMPTMGQAEPIQPASTGTPYQPSAGSNSYQQPEGVSSRGQMDLNHLGMLRSEKTASGARVYRQRSSSDFVGSRFGEGLARAMPPTNPSYAAAPVQAAQTPQANPQPSNPELDMAMDQWRGEMSRARLTPKEWAAQQARSRQSTNDPYVFAGRANSGVVGNYDAEMARRFNQRRANEAEDIRSQEDFLRNWRPGATFDEWRAARQR